jgi:hypothetical protein
VEEEKSKDRIEEAKNYAKNKDDKVDYKKLWKLIDADLTTQEREAKFEFDKEQNALSKLRIEEEKTEGVKGTVPPKGSKDEKSTDPFVNVHYSDTNKDQDRGILQSDIPDERKKIGLFDKARTDGHRARSARELGQTGH